MSVNKFNYQNICTSLKNVNSLSRILEGNFPKLTLEKSGDSHSGRGGCPITFTVCKNIWYVRGGKPVNYF